MKKTDNILTVVQQTCITAREFNTGTQCHH